MYVFGMIYSEWHPNVLLSRHSDFVLLRYVHGFRFVRMKNTRDITLLTDFPLSYSI